MLIPLALGWLLLLGAIDVGRDAGWNPVAVVGRCRSPSLLGGYGLLRAAGGQRQPHAGGWRRWSA